MVKLPYGQKLCKISNVPYQAFRFKAGPQGRYDPVDAIDSIHDHHLMVYRYKETVICYNVAKERNICQVCLNDMRYGLPVGVRDALLEQELNAVKAPDSAVGSRL
jgi:pre-mRNA-splicing factor RBM22/SLT11